MRASFRSPVPPRARHGAGRLVPCVGLALALAVATTPPAAPDSGGAYRDCRCLAQGERYRLGERVCLRGQIAVCERVLNNTSWRLTEEACAPTT